MKKCLLFTGLLLLSQIAHADDIGFGTIKGIKVYDFTNSKVTKIYLSANATNKDNIACDGIGEITHASRDTSTRKEMVSIALAAYAAGKKVRIYSETNSCEAEFIAIQETYF